MLRCGPIGRLGTMKPSKYALPERERRFLVAELPGDEPWARRSITDLYLDQARIRLRVSDGMVNGEPELQRKLTQKIPETGGPLGRQGRITTMYLNETEYRCFASLPGAWLTKERLSFPPMGVDVFGGPLAGLIVAEAEFAADEPMDAFVPPPWCGREITAHPDLTGANLARLSALPGNDGARALAAILSSLPGGIT